MEKKFYILIPILLLTQFILAQNNYDVDIIKENSVNKKNLNAIEEREKIGKCKFIPTFEFKEGDRFIFEKNETAIKEGWDLTDYFFTREIKKDSYDRTKLYFKDFAGKVIRLIKIEEKKGIVSPESYYTFELEDSKEQISIKAQFSREYQKAEYLKEESKRQVFVLPHLIYLSEIDSFRDNFIGKTYYTNFLSNGKKFQAIKIIKAGAGSESAPIRVIFENMNGQQDFKDLCTCGTNVHSIFIDRNFFENYFLTVDPKISYQGDEETWNLITQAKIKVGMSESDLILSWGEPKKINQTVTSGKISKQFVYYDQYVYTENGKVTSFQSLR